MKIDHLINGHSVAGSNYFETINPATQQVLAEVTRVLKPGARLLAVVPTAPVAGSGPCPAVAAFHDSCWELEPLPAHSPALYALKVRAC